MFGVVLATLNRPPTPSTPRTAAMAALRRNPVPREAIVPTAMVRVDRPSPSEVTSRGPVPAQRASCDPDADGQQQRAGTDAGDGQGDPAVLRAAHDQRPG